MSTYLALKRFKHHGVDNMPGAKLTDVENATILMERGYITPVPDNFTPPPATVRTRASASAGSGARRPKPKVESTLLSSTSAVTIGTPVGKATPINQDDSPLPTVDQLLDVGYTQEAAEAMAEGKTNEITDAETDVIEAAVEARPDILDLSRSTEESLADLIALSDEEYKELVRAYLTAPGAGTVGAAEDTGVSHATAE